MAQQTLHTRRLELAPLADAHLQWEVELDWDPEVMRYLSARASTREEVEAAHARRMAAARKVDGLGFWVGLVADGFVGCWWLQPAHGAISQTIRAWPTWATGCYGVSGGKGSPRRGRWSWCATDSMTSGSTGHRPDSQRQCRLAGCHGACRTHLRSDIFHLHNRPVEGIEVGEVEYEMTRKQWAYRAT